MSQVSQHSFFQSKTLIKALVIATSALAVVACNDNSNSMAGMSDNMAEDTYNDMNGDMMQEKSNIAFTPMNLAYLGEDYDYEGWLITSKGAIATGKFDIDPANPTATQNFMVNRADAEDTSKFVLTIEPQMEEGADVTAPSKVHIIAGDVMNNTSTLTTSHSAALGTDFSSAMGKYFLATPTNGNATPTQGIWYIDNSTGTMMPGLHLPKLPEGWVYEGWIVDEMPLSTGTFNANNDGMVMMADSDGAGEAAGDMDAPAFPGQDYVNPAKDLVGKTAVISVEPDPDNSDAPFSIKPLVSQISDMQGVQSMDNKAMGNLPSAMISITDN